MSLQTHIFTACTDASFLKETIPPLITMCRKLENDIVIILETSKPNGVLGKTLPQTHFKELLQSISELKEIYSFSSVSSDYQSKEIKNTNIKCLGYPFKETHCFRGYPIFGSFKQFLDTSSKYLLHLDCDMIFYEAPDFSWIQEGMRIMEENEDILCVLPRGGPPTKDGSLNQFSTEFSVDDKRGLYLFKNFTSRHYLIHRERFLSLLPLKPLWLSWREPIKSRLFGCGKMLCWETMVENALINSDMWRADLMTEQAWSLHPGDRSEEFYQLLPKIIDSVNRNQFPEDQRGHFDLRLSEWKHFLN